MWEFPNFLLVICITNYVWIEVQLSHGKGGLDTKVDMLISRSANLNEIKIYQ
jgi:hypothetical protein